MKWKYNLTIFFWLLLTFTITVYAVEPLPRCLINLGSQPGADLFKEDLNENSLKLLSNFTTQKTHTYCGIASMVMILNSIDIPPPLDAHHSPYHYFNQENFLNEKIIKIIPLQEIQKNGISLTKLSEVIRIYGLDAKPFFANDLNLEKFRSILRDAILNRHFIIVNFSRAALHLQGGGHHSPIAAYDENTDRFLILDVARYKYPAYWVRTEALWKAIHTKDGDTYRGFIIIKRI
jgi:hypothetical protein